MTDETSTSTYADRWGLGFGKPDSDRRAALVDPETGEPHRYRLSDAAIARRNAEVAVELLRIYSHQGRVFISPDTAGLYALTLNAITMSEDSIALFDGIREVHARFQPQAAAVEIVFVDTHRHAIDGDERCADC